MIKLNSKIIKNASWIIGCRIIQSLISLVIGMISARYLGPSNYGLISYASSVVAFVVPFAHLGLKYILVEEIVAHPNCEGNTMGTSLVLSILSSVLCFGGCIAFVLVANPGEKDTLIVCALYGISLFFQMTEMIQYWYQAKMLSKYTSLTSLGVYIVVALYKIFLLVSRKNIYWFALSAAFDYLLISAVLIILYNKIGNQKLSFSFSLGKKLFARSRYYILSSMMVTLFAQTDKIMIKTIVGNSENGYYATAITCVGITSFVFGAIIDSFRPVIFENKKNSQKHFDKNLSYLYAIVFYMGLAQSIAFTLLAEPIVKILYGSAYMKAVPILRIVVWYTAFSYMGTVRDIWMLAENKQRYIWIINLIGASFNLLGNSILIVNFGACGAAIASVLTQFFTNFVLCWIFKPIRPTAKLIRNALNPKLLLEMIQHR